MFRLWNRTHRRSTRNLSRSAPEGRRHSLLLIQYDYGRARRRRLKGHDRYSMARAFMDGRFRVAITMWLPFWLVLQSKSCTHPQAADSQRRRSEWVPLFILFYVQRVGLVEQLDDIDSVAVKRRKKAVAVTRFAAWMLGQDQDPLDASASRSFLDRRARACGQSGLSRSSPLWQIAAADCVSVKGGIRDEGPEWSLSRHTP